MIAIVTGTIKPGLDMKNLIISNEEERLQQYISALRHLINSGAFRKIIFCENSNYNLEAFELLKKEAKNQETELEVLSFQGDLKQASIHGKGYGEGEIMDYVFENSRLLRNESYFIKLTGRLIIDNISEIVKHLQKNKCYFNIPNRTIRDFYDTRIYGMPTETFQKYFRKAYHRVMDREGTYLERVYTEVLKEQKIELKNFPRYPRIVGISGSSGLTYTYTEWKCKIKDFISMAGGYKVTR